MKLLIPERRRRVVCVLKDRFLVSQPRACWWWVISAAFSAGTTSDGDYEQKLRRRIQELSRRHLRWGRRLVYRVFRQEGWIVNYKRVQQIWLY